MDEKHIFWETFEKILKLFDENSIEKLNLYLFFGTFVAKNRNFGSNIIFLQQFFPVRGGGANLQTSPPPAYATEIEADVIVLNTYTNSKLILTGENERQISETMFRFQKMRQILLRFSMKMVKC